MMYVVTCRGELSDKRTFAVARSAVIKDAEYGLDNLHAFVRALCRPAATPTAANMHVRMAAGRSRHMHEARPEFIR